MQTYKKKRVTQMYVIDLMNHLLNAMQIHFF